MLLLGTIGIVVTKRSPTRSVAPLRLAETRAPQQTFSRTAATGLFVGVRAFPHDQLLEVPYAVDDAIDLAYLFTLYQRVGLIPPRRAVLVLSGTPQKKESEQRLADLRAAGAELRRDASADEILELVRTQAASAGDDGIFVLSIASHGFQQNGDSYILGSTSTFGSPESSLRTATILDVAAHARRSLIFLDACRDRIGQGARSGAPDPAAAAPHIRRMKHVQGQVIFYAAAPGEYAFDDHVNRNGVFTKAVLDGLSCEASAPRGTVIVETLHTFIDRAVRRWIQENKHRTVDPATQISMEGQTRNMPLCECWRSPRLPIRVAVDRTFVTAYDDETRLLWRQDFLEPVVHAEAADLDADGLYEVVVGLRNRIVVLDRDKKERWSRSVDAKTLRTFATGDLFEKHTNQIVALWNDDHGSRMEALASDGDVLASFEYAGLLQHVAIGRPTNMHNPRIVVAARNTLLLFMPKKLARGVPVWRRVLRAAATDVIAGLRIDPGEESPRNIAVRTASGTTWFTFDGKVLRQNAKGTWQQARGR